MMAMMGESHTWRVTGGLHGTQYIVAHKAKIDYSYHSKETSPDHKVKKTQADQRRIHVRLPYAFSFP